MITSLSHKSFLDRGFDFKKKKIEKSTIQPLETAN